MNNFDYIGFDVHKKSISFCAKAQDGRIVDEGKIAARRGDLSAWARARSRPWLGAMEATLFTGWIYDHLRPMAQELKVAHPAMAESDRSVEEERPGRCAKDRGFAALWSRASAVAQFCSEFGASGKVAKFLMEFG